MSDRAVNPLAQTVPDGRVSGVYTRPTSDTLAAKADLVRELAAQVRRGELSPLQVAGKLELLAAGLDVDAGGALALEAGSR
jgi:hypothetical protein